MFAALAVPKPTRLFHQGTATWRASRSESALIEVWEYDAGRSSPPRRPRPLTGDVVAGRWTEELTVSGLGRSGSIRRSGSSSCAI